MHQKGQTIQTSQGTFFLSTLNVRVEKEGQIQNWRKVFMGGQIIDPEIRYLVPPKVSARGVYNI